MPSRARLDWHGDALVERVRAAARASVDETVDDARDDAEASHAWQNRPTRFSPTGGQLEEEIITVHADPADANPTASFGTTRRRGFVGLFHEEGTVHEFARPFLRPAADRAFPSLARRIRGRLGL